MRVVVTGGRKYRDRKRVYQDLDDADQYEPIDVIIEGEADGLDKIAKQWAIDRGVPYHEFAAAWDDIDRPGAVIKRTRNGRLYDAAAGAIRNQKMIDIGEPDVCCAWPGRSGTEDMMKRCKAAGLPVWRFDKGNWPNEDPASRRRADNDNRRDRSDDTEVQERRAVHRGQGAAPAGRLPRRAASRR